MEKKQFFEKSHNAKKLKGDPLGFFNIHSVAKQQKKIEGGPFGENIFRKKVSQCRKKIEREEGPFGLARYGMLRGKTGKSFLVQFAGQMEQFDTIVFGRIFKNYFGQFMRIEKKEKKSHYNSRVSLHEAPTKKARTAQSWRKRMEKFHIGRPNYMVAFVLVFENKKVTTIVLRFYS